MLFSKSGPLWHTKALMLVVTQYCLLEQLVRGLLFDIWIGLVADCKAELSPILWCVDKCLDNPGKLTHAY